jgi:hypothetical protein
VPRALRSCFIWLAIYAPLAWGFAFLLERRMIPRSPALFGGLLAALLVVIALGTFGSIVIRLRSLGGPSRGINGEDPIDGEKYAAWGPIEYSGLDTMVSPITQKPAVMYAYRIRAADGRSWQGARLAPCRIRCGDHSIRILALPLLDFDAEWSRGDANRYPERWIETTSFTGEVGARLVGDLRLPDSVLKDESGAIEWNVGDGNVPNLGKATFYEQVVAPAEVVCAIGRYSAARGGLVVDPGARGSSIVLRKKKPESAAAAIFGSIGSAVKGAIPLAITAAGLLALHTFVPLGFVEIERPDFRPSWLEVRADDLIEAKVRGKAAQAGFMPQLEMEPGRGLAVGEARGWVKSARGEATIARAELRPVDETIDVLLFDPQGKLAGAIKISKRGELLRALVLGEEVDFRNVPVATYEFGDRRDTFAIPGRVSWYAKDVPSIRVRFRAGWPAQQ